MIRITVLSLSIFILLGSASQAALSQDFSTSTLTPTDEEKAREKAEAEKRAFTLLDQIVNEAQMLRLSENRIRVQIGAADLFWATNEGRSRSLFLQAADGVAELMNNPDTGSRRGQPRVSNQLRQELVLTAARHDAQLAYQVLALTRPQTLGTAQRDSRQPDPEMNLEQTLLARIAALDPDFALQNALQMLEKGQFPRSLVNVLAQLQVKDKDAAAKLTDRVVSQIKGANMLSNFDAGNLALGLLQPGPRMENNSPTEVTTGTARQQLLSLSTYQDLLGSVIDAALKATPTGASTARGDVGVPRRRPGGGGGGGRITATTGSASDAQIEQLNARQLLSNLRMLLPQIEQHLPARAQSVRQKMAEMNVGNNPREGFNQIFQAMQQGTSESIMTAAATAPPGLQSRIYQQAALKALEEGYPDRARQIANDHLDEPMRDVVLRNLEFRQLANKTNANSIDEVRMTLGTLQSNEDRINFLLQVAVSTQQANQELTLQVLDEARRIAMNRANNYQQLEQQLRVAEAFRGIEPARSFEILEPGLMQLNELLSAAALLNGFEVNIFRDGELPLQGGSNLSNTISRYGTMIGVLAKSDFERAQSLANRFQLTEPRIMARLSIVRSVLGVEGSLANPPFRGRGFRQNILRRP